MEYGLIGAGPVNQYFAGKLPRLHQQLGPVAATNHRLASRIVNTLRSGIAMRDLSGLAECHLILICAPGVHIRHVREHLRSIVFDWKHKCIVICESESFSSEFEFLRSCGAQIASLRSIPGAGGRYLVEGDRVAARFAHDLVAQVKGSAVEIPSHHVSLYQAALALSNSLFTPILESCTLALRATGVTGVAAQVVTESLFSHTLRLFMYSGRKSWNGPLARGDFRSIDQHIRALERVSPKAADVYRSGVEAAVGLLGGQKKTGAKKVSERS